MARIYKRGSKWEYAVELGKDALGIRRRKVAGGFPTQKKAREEATLVENEVINKTFINESDISFSDYAEEWLKRYSLNVKVSTVRVREHEVGHLKKQFKNLLLKDITKKRYQNILVAFKNINCLAGNTIAGIHGTARMIFREAVEFDLIKTDPTQYAKLPREQQTIEDIESADDIPEYMEKDELLRFLDFAKKGKEFDFIILLTLAYTGMRVGELCSLKWSDINFEDYIISVTKTYYNPQNSIKKYMLLTPKTKASIRKISITDTILSELKLHRVRQAKDKMLYRDIWHDKDFVFTTKKHAGYPIYPKHVGNRMTAILRLSGLNQELTPHSLRHTHTSLLAEAGVGLEEIMERLGHSDDEVTRKVYLHVTKTMKKEAAQKFDLLLNSP